MAIELPPLDDRSKNFIAGAVIFALAAGGAWYMLIKPKDIEILNIEGHALSLEKMNDSVKTSLAGTSEAQLKADAARLTRELQGLRRLVPTENEVPGLLASISTSARKAGLELSEFTPEPATIGETFDVFRYKIAVTGPYHRVAQFMTNIGSLDRIVSPINLTLAVSAGRGEKKPGKNEAWVDAKFGVQTYVAKTRAPAPAAPPAAKAGGI